MTIFSNIRARMSSLSLSIYICVYSQHDLIPMTPLCDSNFHHKYSFVTTLWKSGVTHNLSMQGQNYVPCKHDPKWFISSAQKLMATLHIMIISLQNKPFSLSLYPVAGQKFNIGRTQLEQPSNINFKREIISHIPLNDTSIKRATTLFVYITRIP